MLTSILHRLPQERVDEVMVSAFQAGDRAQESFEFGAIGTAVQIRKMNDEVEEATALLQKHDNILFRIGRAVLRFLGIITSFGRALDDLEYLRERVKSLQDEFELRAEPTVNEATLDGAKLDLQRARSRADRMLKQARLEALSFQRDLQQLNQRLDEFGSMLGQTGDVMRLRGEVSEIRAALHEGSGMIEALKRFYVGLPEYAPILSAIVSYENVVEKAAALERRLVALATNQPPPEHEQRIFTVVQRGGIQNGGNTCYLASAMQVIASVPQLASLFDPQRNRLPAPELTRMQEQGSDILKKISRGQVVLRSEIDTFRRSCFDLGLVPADTLMDWADAQEVLTNICDVLGYDMHFQVEQIVRPTRALDEDGWNPLDSDRSDMSSVDDLLDRSTHQASLEVTPYPQLDMRYDEMIDHLENNPGAVAAHPRMQDLVDQYWNPEEVELNVKRFNPLGPPFHEYRSITGSRLKTPVVSSFPDVLCVNFKQIPARRVSPVGVDYIHPAGTDPSTGEGIGPRYRLCAAIEQCPGHYVARIRQDNGRVVEANDDFVSRRRGFDGFPGMAYLYVKERA